MTCSGYIHTASGEFEHHQSQKTLTKRLDVPLKHVCNVHVRLWLTVQPSPIMLHLFLEMDILGLHDPIYKSRILETAQHDNFQQKLHNTH